MTELVMATEPVALDPVSSRKLLERYGVPLVAEQVVMTADEAVAAAHAMSGPVVLKAVAPGLVHKSDVGGIAVGLLTADDVTRAAHRMTDTIPSLSGFVVQETVEGSLEVIVGLRRDPELGPFVMVGLGGVLVEVLNDVALRPVPVSGADAHAMLDELRAVALLDGYRGLPASDREAVVRAITALSRLAEGEPRVVEVDLNPVVVWRNGALAVDHHVVAAPTDPPLSEPRPDATSALDRLMRPNSIAVIGASARDGKPGRRLVDYLRKHDFPGPIYAINPRSEDVLGLPTYPRVADIPEVPDLACIAVPAEQVLPVVEECARIGVPAAIIYTSGFAEVGPDGRRLQDEIRDIADRSGMRIAGPNTAGVVNAHHRLCAAIGMAFEIDTMPRGDIAFLTQSGAIGSSLLSRTWEHGIGFSTWITCGNEADLTLADYLNHVVEDPHTRVVAIFMEGLRDPDGFLRACEAARRRGKPVVVYKTGRSELGRNAVASHTAALAGDDALYDVLFRQAGVVRVPSLQGLIDAAVALAWQPLPLGRRLAVISASGGACSVVADECARAGLELPALADDVVARIADIIPTFGRSQNPVDVTVEITSNPQMVARIAEMVLAEPSIDALLVMLTTNAGPTAVEVARGVTRAAGGSVKPVVVARLGADYLSMESVAHYRANKIPLYAMPEQAVQALSVMVQAGASRHEELSR